MTDPRDDPYISYTRYVFRTSLSQYLATSNRKPFGLRQIFTGRRPTGKAERFIQTALRDWAYARAYSVRGGSAVPDRCSLAEGPPHQVGTLEDTRRCEPIPEEGIAQIT